MSDAMRKSPLTRRHWITKHNSGWCSIGVMAKRWGLRPTDVCPQCKEVETARHVWHCNHPSALEIWDQSITTFGLQLGRIHTAPAIISAIITRLQDWKRKRPFSPLTLHLPHLATAVQAQDCIGWASFLEGGISYHWRAAQDYFLEYTSSPRSSRTWAAALILKAQSIAWDQWQHRNRALHDDASLDADILLTVDADIRQEFLLGSRLLHKADRGLFKGGVKRVLAYKKLERKQQWLQQVHDARSNWQTRAHPVCPPESRILLQWLRSHPIP